MPDVNPIIAQLQSGVDALTGGTLTSGQITDEQAKKLLQDRPDVAAEFQRASSTADKNSPVFKQKGLDADVNYARYWYTQMGGNQSYSFDSQKQPTPQQTADGVTQTATQGTQTAVDQVGQQVDDTTTLINNQSAYLNALMQGYSDMFAKSQQGLLDQFTQAQADNAKQMGDLVAQLQKTVAGQAQTGQPEKKPNYSRALAQNKELNSGGLSSTMLTGSAGVAPTSLTLGFTSLLGG